MSQVEIPSRPIDYRLGDEYRAGRQRYLEVSLPPDVQALAVRVAALCRHTLAGIDIKRDANGDYFVLESNSAPIYLDIEQKLGHPISATMAKLVISKQLRFS